MTTQDHINYTETKNAGVRLDLSLFSSIKQYFLQIKKTADNKRAYKSMVTLPDYLLKDIGVSREEIQAKLENPTWELKK